jgi:hypothetical protein
MRSQASLAVIALAALSGACASNPPPAATAAGVERFQCEPGATAEAERLVGSATVLSVQPIYSHVMTSNNNSEERVNGAKIVVRPPAGVTAEQMTRTLQCENARILLGKVQADTAERNPYWLPDRWLSVEVWPENGNFAVKVRGDSVGDNLQVFQRVNRYAEQRMMAAGAELP